MGPFCSLGIARFGLAHDKHCEEQRLLFKEFGKLSNQLKNGLFIGTHRSKKYAIKVTVSPSNEMPTPMYVI